MVQLRAVLCSAESDGKDLQRCHPGGEGAHWSQLSAKQVLQAEEDAEHKDVPGVAPAGQPAGLFLGAAQKRSGQTHGNQDEDSQRQEQDVIRGQPFCDWTPQWRRGAPGSKREGGARSRNADL